MEIFLSEVFRNNSRKLNGSKTVCFSFVLIPFGQSSGQAPETKNQEQTIPPHQQPCIAFVRSSRAFS